MEIKDILKQKDSIKQWIEGFVDDTSLFTNTGLDSNDILNLKQKLKREFYQYKLDAATFKPEEVEGTLEHQMKNKKMYR